MFCQLDFSLGQLYEQQEPYVKNMNSCSNTAHAQSLGEPGWWHSKVILKIIYHKLFFITASDMSAECLYSMLVEWQEWDENRNIILLTMTYNHIRLSVIHDDDDDKDIFWKKGFYISISKSLSINTDYPGFSLVMDSFLPVVSRPVLSRLLNV